MTYCFFYVFYSAIVICIWFHFFDFFDVREYSRVCKSIIEMIRANVHCIHLVVSYVIILSVYVFFASMLLS